jgi:predicted GH43/DUF377 family glycosyl hydrolase
LPLAARGNPIEVLRPRPQHFDSTSPETDPLPVLTTAGIVVLYNGKNAVTDGDPDLRSNAYMQLARLSFDIKDPAHLLKQTDHPVLKPIMSCEKTGQ